MSTETDRYESGYRDGYREAETWTLTLNRYQRDNLLQLVNVIGWPSRWRQGDDAHSHSAIEPLHVLNSGDWLGEIGFMLAAEGTPAQFQLDAEKTGSPLQSREEIERRIAEWLQSR